VIQFPQGDGRRGAARSPQSPSEDAHAGDERLAGASDDAGASTDGARAAGDAGGFGTAGAGVSASAGGVAEQAVPGGGGRGSGPRVDARGLPVERFWNLPNTVTMLRIGVVPILLFVPVADGPTGSRFMAWAFIIAALTDWLDGYLARRDGGKHVTRIGKLLDPLADKLIVSTALIMLLAMGRIPLWGAAMVVVIVGRELAVTGLRGIASSHGMVVAAAGPGKLKTVAQSAAIAALLFHYETLGLPAHAIGMTLLAIATALTLWSGYLYFSEYFGWQRDPR
jgi:CDP-diacylglycerol--glycerol-3-phosphate 3-phosphatidyltransferase